VDRVPTDAGQEVSPLVAWKAFETERPTLDAVKRWFQRWPTANIGSVTGAVSGMTVLDLDVKLGKRGDNTLAALVAQHGKLPYTPRQRTWSGGMQVFLAHAPGVRNSAARIGHGLDIRGDGGYILAPPSVVEDAGRSGTYEWIVPPTVPLAPMPGWLLALILRAQGPATSGTPRYDRGRNDALFRMARALHWRGRSEAEIRDTVRMENLEKCHPAVSA
jgi:hypothetical protein